MRKLNVAIPLLFIAVAACSKQAANTSSPTADATDVMASESAAGADQISSSNDELPPPPNIGANVAPGVAFDYQYSFSLPADKISAAQEGHATLCEKLGIVHCRVTGMKYDKTANGQIQASLSFKLDPAIAHSFARDATDLVERNDGTLSDSQIKGEDVGSQIVEGDHNKAQIEADLAKIDVQLKIPNLSKGVRSRLVVQQGDLREQLRELAQAATPRWKASQPRPFSSAICPMKPFSASTTVPPCNRRCGRAAVPSRRCSAF